MFTIACSHHPHQHHLDRRTIALLLRRQTHSRALPQSQRRMVLIRYDRGSRPLAGGSRPVAEGARLDAPGSFGNDSGQPERELRVVGTLPLARRFLAELVTIGVQQLRSWPTGSTSAVSEGAYYSGDRLCGRCAYIFISLFKNLIGTKYTVPQLLVLLLLWVVLAKGCCALACRSRRYFARSVQVVQKVVDLFEVTTAAQWACYSAPTAGVRVLESIQSLLHHAHIHFHAFDVPGNLPHFIVHGLQRD